MGELILFKKDAGPAAAFRGLGGDESLSDGIGGGYPLIRYKGKVWKLQLRGDVHAFVDDKGYPIPYLDVIILRQAQNKSKAYFENYEENSTDAPICSSMDGIVPDPGVLHKQSDTCALCPRNVFKTNEKGIKAKDCGDAKRLAVVPMPTQTAKLLGAPLVEPVFLRVPAASLGALAAYGDEGTRMGYPYFSLVTRIDFDPEKAYPKMRFHGIQPLGDAEAAKVLELREDPQSYRICSGERGGVRQLAAPGQQPIVTFQPAPPPSDPPPPNNIGLVQPARDQVAAQLKADREARIAAIHAEADKEEQAAKQPNPPTQPATMELKANPTPVLATLAPVETGLTGLAAAGASPTAAPTAPATLATGDTGEPEQADAALDAAINALLPQ